MEKITLKQLQDWPFKLGATFRLVAKELLASGWDLTLLESNPERGWGYFLAQRSGQYELLASLKTEFFANLNGRLGYLITTNKARTYEYAKQFKVPVPESMYFSAKEVPLYENFLHWPGIVVKPRNGSSGSGITVDVKGERNFTSAVAQARTVDQDIVIQELVTGDDHRLLFLDHQLFAAIRREPASVTGDGKHTLKELIEIRNAIPKGDDYRGTTSPVVLAEVVRVFGEAILETVPAKGEKVVVSDKANLSLGGAAYDVTERVHPAYQDLLQPLIASLGLRICGVDVMTADITKDPLLSGAKVLEVNAAPNIRPHLYPTEGESRNAATKIVAMLEQRA